jgi:hypothetical protein
MLDIIKRYFYHRELSSQRVSSHHSCINLADAKTICILYDSSQSGHDVEIGSYVQRLRDQGKQVELLAYINDKKQDTKGNISIFNPKDTSWCEVPNTDRALAIAAKKFDLLLSALTVESLPLEYISYVSQARYRVGPYTEGKEGCYDLMIHTEQQPTLRYLLDQMTDLLQRIKY